MSLRGYDAVKRLPRSFCDCKSHSPSEPFGDVENIRLCRDSNSDIQCFSVASIQTGTKDDLALLYVYVHLPDCTVT